MRRTISVFPLVLAATTLLVACGSRTPTAAIPTSPGGQPPVVTITPTGSLMTSGLRARDYKSIQELVGDSTAVVRVTATSADTGVGPTVALPTAFPTVIIPVEVFSYTVTTVRVNAVLYGSVSGPEIRVRQDAVRGTNIVREDVGPLMEVGKSYVLFLKRAVGSVPFDYFLTGGPAGLYTDQGGTLGKTDVASFNLPATLSISDLQRTISMGVSTAVVPSVVATPQPGSPSAVPSTVTTVRPSTPSVVTR